MEAVCGGMAMYATCHCYILNDIELPEKGDIEEALCQSYLQQIAPAD